MKVLLINQVFYPDSVATAQHLTDLALYFKKNGVDVTVVTGNRNYERREIVYSSYEEYQGIKIHRVGSTGFGKRSFFHRLVDAVTFDLALLVKLLFIPKQDVIISFTSPPLVGMFGAFFKMIKGGHLVQWMMDVNPEAAIAVGYLKAQSLPSRFLLGLFRWSLLKADQTVVLDRYMKEKIVAHGFPEENVVVVPPWPVQQLKKPDITAADDNPFRKANGLQGKFIILFSGNHSIVHPLDTVLEAALLLEKRKDIAFVFIGGGLRAEQVTTFKEKHKLANIYQLPFQPREMLKYSLGMANLHVVVLGEKVNGLVHTSKVYGILATGAPYVAVAPRRSHLGDLLEECPYGFLVEHGKPEQFLDVIEKAQQLTPDQLVEYGEKNFNHAAKKYSAEECLGKVYEKLILRNASTSSDSFEPKRSLSLK